MERSASFWELCDDGHGGTVVCIWLYCETWTTRLNGCADGDSDNDDDVGLNVLGCQADILGTVWFRWTLRTFYTHQGALRRSAGSTGCLTSQMCGSASMFHPSRATTSSTWPLVTSTSPRAPSRWRWAPSGSPRLWPTALAWREVLSTSLLSSLWRPTARLALSVSSQRLCVCVCVWERERQRENVCVWERQRQRQRQRVYMHVCLFIWTLVKCLISKWALSASQWQL